MSDVPCRRSVPVMGTIVTIDVPAQEAESEGTAPRMDAINRAIQWFFQVERRCSRFDPQSELMQLTNNTGLAVAVSDILYEAVQFALSVAEESGGAFDPTIGSVMETRGFNRDYSTGKTVRTGLDLDRSVTYQDVLLDPEERTITLLRPLILDLGAVAKGLAMDLAARELQEFESFSVDAGGDLYLGGHNPRGEPWTVGIRHPRRDQELIDVVYVSDRAVCTSGDYERPQEGVDEEHHILDPRRGISPRGVASATVVAPMAMLADAAATAAFVLGTVDGIQFLDRLGLDGVLISTDLNQYATRGMAREYKLGTSTIL